MTAMRRHKRPLRSRIKLKLELYEDRRMLSGQPTASLLAQADHLDDQLANVAAGDRAAGQLRFGCGRIFDGGGDGFSWSDPLNWNDDVLPATNEIVCIPAAPYRTVILTENTEVRAILADANFVLSANLTISDVSSTNADFEMTPGAQLTADGVTGQFTANGDTIINGGSLLVENQGQIVLPNVFNYDFASTGNSQRRTWQVATGGSLQLPNLQVITGGQNLDADMSIVAESGGQIDVSSLVMIADPAAGDLRNRSIDVRADGAGSLIDLSALQTFLDRQASELTGNGQYSGLAALNGGSLQLSTNPADDIQLTGVRLRLDDSSSLPRDRIESLRDGRVELSGGIPFQFPVLTDGHSTEWVVTGPSTSLDLPQLVDLSEGLVQLSGGGTATAPLVTNIDGASFDIRDNVAFTLTLPTNYDFASTGNSQRRTWQVATDGSLQLPNLQTITGGQNLDSDMTIEAFSGGQIDLSSLIMVADPAAGDLRNRSIDVRADGAGSLIDLSALQTFLDRQASELTGNGQYSGLAALNGGSLQLSTNPADDIQLTGVRLRLDDSSSLPRDRIESLARRPRGAERRHPVPVPGADRRTQYRVGRHGPVHQSRLAAACGFE